MSKSASKASAASSSQNDLEYTKKKSFGYVYGYYFRALQDYHDGQLGRLEAEFFEYLLGMSDYYLREGHATFYHSYGQMKKDTRIAVNTLKKMIKEFIELGVLTTRLSKQYGRQVTTLEVDYLGIIRKRKILFGESDPENPGKFERVRGRCVALVKMYVARRRLLKAKSKRY